jgi:carbonic anhydrase/acetyltransferase-like protein (isoleucine patch superfamily)
MILTHGGKHPRIDPTAWIAPDATVCGDVFLRFYFPPGAQRP